MFENICVNRNYDSVYRIFIIHKIKEIVLNWANYLRILAYNLDQNPIFSDLWLQN
ncbi:hypothetical protein Emtol_0544 [Emticicia oligotrophica DSM 17448]|uniref:Integrase n=1 Tax=Emticicia oligotrophica (strain DSM 17448 / CIP 109782 / MTCC 6937 / GPTSA100-15) TaxID=929562 RepID=A0ABM5MX90_EMTOG|nr:hypothetical protein Emtol_0544 [Emticicia oligotrophica DSM 17448]